MPKKQILQLEKGIFVIDGVEGEFDGWHDPSVRWNGFAVPFFTKNESEELICKINESTDDWYHAYYNEENDSFHIDEKYLDADEQMQPFSGSNLKTPEGNMRLYGICGFHWCWNEKHDFD